MPDRYVIRKVAFTYTDEYYVDDGLGAIESHFTSEDEARKALRNLQVKAMRERPMHEFKQFSYPRKEKSKLVNDYLNSILDEPLLKYSEKWDYYYAGFDTMLPATLTDEQVLKVMELAEIRFYEMKHFQEAEAHYYIIWLPALDKPVQVELNFEMLERGWVITPIFFETRDQALDSLSRYGYYLRRVPFDDTFENLSNQPDLLKSFVEGKSSFVVSNGKVRLDDELERDHIVGINALLKEPLFEIRTISIEEAATIPHDGFEAI